MKKWLCVAGWLCPLLTWAQNPIADILQQVENNNLLLQSAVHAVKAQQATLAAENNLPDPEVEYIHQWGSRPEIGNQTELVVKQEFDFPTAYAQRNRYRRLKNAALGHDVDLIRQDVRWQAARLSVQLIGLNRETALLLQVMGNLQRHVGNMEKALQEGDVVILEVNKLKMSMMDINVELRNNDADYRKAIQELILLNGGKELTVEANEYPVLPEVLQDMNALAEDYRLHDAHVLRMSDEVMASNQQVKVKQAEGLPRLHVGYRRNTSISERFNGVVGGFSIPLFSNRHKVKAARAELTSRQLQLQDQLLQVQSVTQSLFNRKEQLQNALASYDRKLIEQQIELLGKALDLGEMNVMDYLTELNQILTMQKDYAALEQEYQQVCYELLKYRL